MRARVICLVAVGFLSAVPVARAQTDASDAPSVSGPLVRVTKQCGRGHERNDGVVIAVVRSCLRFYTFRITSETNPVRDYGVIWLQANVDTRHRWCATTVKSDILVPRGARLEEGRPKVRRPARRRRHTTRLVVDAGGYASRNAVIKKSFVVYPRLMRGLPRNRRRVFRTVWFGSSGRELAFVSGAEISWRTLDGSPPRVQSRLRYELRRKRSC